MKRPYETCVVFDGTLSEDDVAREQQQVEKFLKQNGDFDSVEVWGKRRLAYEINKRRSGVYCLFRYESQGDMPGKLERLFKLNTNILRHLTLQRDPRREARIAAAEEAAAKRRAAAAARELESGERRDSEDDDREEN